MPRARAPGRRRWSPARLESGELDVDAVGLPPRVVDQAAGSGGVELVRIPGVHGVVEAVDIGLMVLGVMQFHDLARDVRLESTVVVGQVGKDVTGHRWTSGTVWEHLTSAILSH